LLLCSCIGTSKEPKLGHGTPDLSAKSWE
jgi:hypothetical protein